MQTCIVCITNKKRLMSQKTAKNAKKHRKLALSRMRYKLRQMARMRLMSKNKNYQKGDKNGKI